MGRLRSRAELEANSANSNASSSVTPVVPVTPVALVAPVTPAFITPTAQPSNARTSSKRARSASPEERRVLPPPRRSPPSQLRPPRLQATTRGRSSHRAPTSAPFAIPASVPAPVVAAASAAFPEMVDPPHRGARLRTQTPSTSNSRIVGGLANMSRDEFERHHFKQVAPETQKQINQCQAIYEGLAHDTDWAHLVPTLQSTFGQADCLLELADLKAMVLYYIVTAKGRIGTAFATDGQRLVTRHTVASFVRRLVMWHQRKFYKSTLTARSILSQLLAYASSPELAASLNTNLSTVKQEKRIATLEDILVMIPASLSDHLFASTEIGLDLMILQSIIGESGIRIGGLAANVGYYEPKDLFTYSDIRVLRMPSNASRTDPHARPKLVLELNISTQKHQRGDESAQQRLIFDDDDVSLAPNAAGRILATCRLVVLKALRDGAFRDVSTSEEFVNSVATASNTFYQYQWDPKWKDVPVFRARSRAPGVKPWEIPALTTSAACARLARLAESLGVTCTLISQFSVHAVT